MAAEDDEDLLAWKRRVEREATKQANREFAYALLVLTLLTFVTEVFLHFYRKTPW